MTTLDRILLGVNAGLITIITWFIRSWILSVEKKLEILEKDNIALKLWIAKNESCNSTKT